MAETPVIPDYITVHLGLPDDKSAPNVRVSFPDYIKNVASSEIYPTWPENAIRANIYAQVTYALNRVYTEWYRSRGYDFDITNSTQYDQAYVQGREIFDNIAEIVDEQFDDYLVRPGSVEPLFAQYCNGTTVTCAGLSQWGTVPLAEQGMTPYEILTSFYGENLNIVRDAPVAPAVGTYPGTALRLGSVGNAVRDVQTRLNRISTNYPAIPKIYPVNGIFDANTEEAVRTFQRLFNLTADGVVGRATWYRLAYLYTSVKRLAELNSEGLKLADVSKQFPSTLREGDDTLGVRVLQYYLAVVAQYVDTVPAPPITGLFGPETTASLRAFQRLAGLPEDGILGPRTWELLTDAYRGILRAAPNSAAQGGWPRWPGQLLFRGSTGQDVTLMQEYLNYIAGSYPEIPSFPVTGYYGDQTAQAVIAFQQIFGLPVDGVIGAITWETIASTYSDLRKGAQAEEGQYPGYELSEGGVS